MGKPIIEVRGLSKRYRLGRIGATLLRDDLNRLWNRIRGRGEEPDEKDFWALRNVSFDVQPGEVLGVIGRNGAGKSTLLKILSNITDPTHGEVVVRGRISSLLEVGTGFHPDLTGMENIFLNGAILGMTRAEVRKRLDEIISFAEIEAFINTPVKRYSSGMYVRLAFAVAAHLEPEILVVDEVLAVGDAQFQKKCIGKIRDASRAHGRTVLLVSHNMGVMANLCDAAVLLKKGEVAAAGHPADIIQSYLKSEASSSGEVIWPDTEQAPGNERVRLHAVRVKVDGVPTSDVTIDHGCDIEVEYWNHSDGLPLCVSIHLLDHMGVEVLATGNIHSANLGRDDWFDKPFPRGLFRSVCRIPANLLNERGYSLRIALCSNVTTVELLTQEVISFQAHDAGAMRKEFGGGWLGVVRPKLHWQTEMVEVNGVKVL
jgi:lipopolysaccharide transport system ATP-binding protein